MNRLLEILLKIFGDRLDLTDLLAKLAAKFLEDLADPSGCKERFLQMLRTGTLDDEFQKNPFGVICCALHVLLALADKMEVHVHTSGPIGAIGDSDNAWVGQLAGALPNIPKGHAADPKGGLEFLIPIMIEQIVLLIKKLIEQRRK